MSRRTLILPIGAGVIGMDDVPLVRIMDSDETPTSITAYGVVDTVQPVLSVTWTVNGVEQEGDVTKSPVLELTDLQPETSYAITLRATNINGESQASTKTIWTKRITTITPADVVDGVTYYDYQDVYRTGTMPEMDETDITVSGRDVTIPAGHYAESETVSVSSEYIIPTGTKNINTNGTDDVTQYASVNVNVPASAVDTGTKQITTNGTNQDVVGYAAVDVNVQPTLYHPTNVTPTTSQQTISAPQGYDGLDSVTVNGVDNSIDPNIQAGNIKEGVTILGVTGNYQGGVQPTGTLTILNNGTYDVTNYANVTVNVVSGDFNELCFTALQSNSKVGMTHTGSNTVSTKPVMYYSTDGRQTWHLWDFTDITLANVDDKVYFYGDNPNGFNYSENDYSKFVLSGQLSVSGNIMTLITRYGDRDIPRDWCFVYLFYQQSALKDAEHLVLPAMTTAGCYKTMFAATGITIAPELPAKTLEYYSYQMMFNGCGALTTVPTFDAEVLNGAIQCSNMFKNCGSLVNFPDELKPKVLADQCYPNMFQNCSSLTKTPLLPADNTGALICMKEMFSGCTSLSEATTLASSLDQQNWMANVAASGTFYKLKGANIPVDSPNGIPVGWTVVEIPAVIDNNSYISFDYNTGTSIYYTLDGTTPTTSSTLYTEPIDTTNLGDKFTLKYLSVYNGTNMPVMTYEYYNMFYIEALDDNTVLNVNNWRDNMMFSTNKKSWAMCNTAPSSNITLTNTGDKVYFKKSSMSDVSMNVGNITTVSGTIKTGGCLEYAMTGNIVDAQVNGRIGNVFENCTGLVDASELKLPVDIEGYLPTVAGAGNGLYYRMFAGCTSLISAPVLPYTTTTVACFDNMFNGCTSLRTAPHLLSEYVNKWSYQSMFANCTNLVNVPEIKARTFGNTGLGGMFSGCTSLTTVEIDFVNVNGYNGIQDMFNGCTNLSRVILPNCTTWKQNYASNWLNNVAPYGVMFIPSSNSQIPTSATNGIPSDWIRGDAPTTDHQFELEQISGASFVAGIVDNGWPVTGNDLKLARITVEQNGTATSCYYDICYSIANNTIYPDKSSTWDDNIAIVSSTNMTGDKVMYIEFSLITGDNITYQLSFEDCHDWSALGYVDFDTCDCQENMLHCQNINDLVCFTAVDPNVSVAYTGKNATFYASTDGGQTFTQMTKQVPVTLSNIGDKVYIYGNNERLCSLTDISNYTYFSISGGDVTVSGDLTRLLNINGLNILPDRAFVKTLRSSHLTSASGLTVNVTSVGDYGLYGLFEDCTNLTDGINALPATTLGNNCYARMYYNCEKLTTTPTTLPATTLTGGCYREMFRLCKRITTAPSLPATTLATSCYDNMFNGCTGLQNAPATLPATTTASGCYYAMFYNCDSLQTAPEIYATSFTEPEFSVMFRSCNNLNSITVRCTSWATNDTNWVEYVAATGTFTKPADTVIPTGNDGIPSGWTVVNV